jgi:hypothetical protein
VLAHGGYRQVLGIVHNPCECIPIHFQSTLFYINHVSRITISSTFQFLTQLINVFLFAALVSEMSVWEGIVVTPLDRAYDENEMKTINDDDNDSNENSVKMEN